MTELIPVIHQEQQGMIKSQINGKQISLIFDGTTHVAEAMVVVLQFIDDEWIIHQHVVQLMFLAKSMTVEEVARQLITTLSIELGIGSNLLVASMRDCASINNVAMDTLKIVYPQVLVGCFAHTLDHVGEHIHSPVRIAQKISLLGKLSQVYLVLHILQQDGGLGGRLSSKCMMPLEMLKASLLMVIVSHQLLKLGFKE